MTDQAAIQEKLKELRHLVRAGRERLATHSPVWAVYLAGETLRSMGEVLDEIDLAMGENGVREKQDRVRKTG